jgi:branched-subunit amino acid aminotransferase/4-amino-4-deoxychorismate lyase
MKLGGTGDAKIGGNYAPGIMPQLQVAKDGYQQILWLFGQNMNITEGLHFRLIISGNYELFHVVGK